MTPLLLLSLFPLLTTVISAPVNNDLELNLPPGPPEIISDDDYDSPSSLYQDSLNETHFYDELPPLLDQEVLKLNVTAFVSRKPHIVDNTAEAGDKNSYDDIIQDLINIKKTPVDSSDLGPQLSWWHILLLSVAALLVTCLCCYFTSCCYLTLDCCSDPFWGCCICFSTRCVQSSKPPPHVKIIPKNSPDVSHSKYSLNENSTAPRTRGSSKSLSYSAKGSTKSVNVINGEDVSQFSSKDRKYSRSSRKQSADGEEERLLSSGTFPRVHQQDTSVHTLSSQQTATLNSVKSVRNYKRTRPASTLNSGDSFARNAGLSESLPHVYQDNNASYFSWLHLFGRSKRRYNVSRRKKKQPGTNGVNGSNNNHIYRQTRYRNIADSRNSAVIPTKISKRSSTASTYNHARPHVYMRSRSAETVDSEADALQPMMETVASERHLPAPRSRLSTNLQQLETSRAVPEYNLQYFERSLMKSKETTL